MRRGVGVDEKPSSGIGRQDSDTKAGTQPGLGMPTWGISAITSGSDVDSEYVCGCVCGWLGGVASAFLGLHLFLLVAASLCLGKGIRFDSVFLCAFLSVLETSFRYFEAM